MCSEAKHVDVEELPREKVVDDELNKPQKPSLKPKPVLSNNVFKTKVHLKKPPLLSPVFVNTSNKPMLKSPTTTTSPSVPRGKVQPSVATKRKSLDPAKVLDDKLSLKKDVVPGSKVSSKPPPAVSVTSPSQAARMKKPVNSRKSLSSLPSRALSTGLNKLNNNIDIPNKNLVSKNSSDPPKMKESLQKKGNLMVMSKTSPNLNSVLKRTASSAGKPLRSVARVHSRTKSSDNSSNTNTLVVKPIDIGESVNTNDRGKSMLRDVKTTSAKPTLKPASLSSRKPLSPTPSIDKKAVGAREGSQKAGLTASSSRPPSSSSSLAPTTSSQNSRSLSSASLKRRTSLERDRRPLKSLTSLSPINKSPRLSKSPRTEAVVGSKEKVGRSSSNSSLGRRNSLERKDVVSLRSKLLSSRSKSTLASSSSNGNSVSKPSHKKSPESKDAKLVLEAEKVKWGSEESQLKKIIQDNCLKFDVMSTCFKVSAEENDKLKDQLSNKRRQLDQMRERTENLQVVINILFRDRCVHYYQSQAEKDKSERLLNQLGADIETMCAKHAEEKAALGKYSLSMICTVHQTSKNSKFLNFKTLKYDANFVVCLTFDFVEFLFLVHEVKSFTFNFSAAQQSHVDALMFRREA